MAGANFMKSRTRQELDRVRRNTSQDTLARIDQKTEDNIRFYRRQSHGQIAARIEDLDKEWSIERYLEMNASAIALGGLVLGLTVSRKWFLLPVAVLGFLFQHAVQGWCPPLPILRRRGIRTRGEIDREKFVLKASRGDLNHYCGPGNIAGLVV
jgi:hypothetical protein